jgi:hypothetical protein
MGLASGESWCDEKTGKIIIKIYNKKCTKVCTKEHEKKHRSLRKTCCQRLKQCVDAGKVAKSLCLKTYNDWVKDTLDESDCKAYKQSVACAKWQMFWKGCKKKKCPKKGCNKCCNDFKDYLSDMEWFKNDHCGKAGKFKKCPFGWWGIIK